MRRMLIAIGGAALVAGCASSAEIQQGAYAHLDKASYLEAHGDYYGATRERRAAQKQFTKAQQRAYDEAYNGYW